MKCSSDTENEIYRKGALEICNCLPTCNALMYEAKLTTTQYDLTRSLSKSEYEIDVKYKKFV